MRSIKFRILPPPDILKNEVECLSIVEYTGESEFAINVVSNSVPGIVFQHQHGQSVIENITTCSGHTAFPPTLFLYGPSIKSSVMNFKAGPHTTTHIILKPHALQTLLGMNATCLTDGFTELGEFSRADLNEQLIETQDEQQQITLLIDFLVTQLRQRKTNDQLVREGLKYIHQNITSATIKHLLDHLGISERQFERRFGQAVGITPQSYIRVRRLNEAIRLIKAKQYKRLTDIAYALNYYDQSHFIRDVKALARLTPKTLTQQEDDFYHEQTGYSYL